MKFSRAGNTEVTTAAVEKEGAPVPRRSVELELSCDFLSARDAVALDSGSYVARLQPGHIFVFPPTRLFEG